MICGYGWKVNKMYNDIMFYIQMFLSLKVQLSWVIPIL